MGWLLRGLVDSQSIANGGANNDFDSERLPTFGEARFHIRLSSAAAVNVTFSVQVSVDGTNWETTTIHDLTAAAAKNVQVANVTLAANTNAVVFGLSNPAPYVRIRIQNNGAAAATISAWLVATTLDSPT